MWRRTWVAATDNFVSWTESFRIVQNSGVGMLIQGSRQWRNYQVSADITPHLALRAGVAARVQGLKRYYSFLLAPGNKLQLVRMLNQETILAECDFKWQLGETYQMSMSVQDALIVATMNSEPVFSVEDTCPDLADGSIALVIEEGRTSTMMVEVQPLF
jgi:hypothetical protein